MSLRPDDVTPFFKAPPSKPKRRKRVKPVSDKTRETFDLRKRLRAAVIERDGGCVLHGETDMECVGAPSVHHRLKASGGGVWSMVNLVCLCCGHNVDIENRPTYYREGWPWLVVRPGDEEYERCKEKGR